MSSVVTGTGVRAAGVVWPIIGAGKVLAGIILGGCRILFPCVVIDIG